MILRTGCIFIIIAFFAGALPAQAPSLGAPGTIEGIVCEAPDCLPISGARVWLSVSGSSKPVKTAVSDASGSFRFFQVPAGKYFIGVAADNFQSRNGAPPATIVNGESLRDIKIELNGLGTVSGRAFDEDGEPVAGTRVELLRTGISSPEGKILVPMASGITDDRGEFRIAALDPDEYYLRVIPSPSRIVRKTYPITYYPNTANPAEAAPIVVAAGREVSGIDPRLDPGGVTIRGRYVHGDGGERWRATSILVSRTANVLVAPFPSSTLTIPADETFEIRGVPPGSYYLYALMAGDSRTTGLQWIRLPIEVGSGDVEDVTVTLVPGGTIKGRVSIASNATDGDRLDLSTLTLGSDFAEFTILALPRWGILDATVSRSGAFEYPRISEGTLFLRTASLPDGWFVSGIELDGEDILGSGFSVSPGRERSLEVIISNAGGSVSGVIKDRQDKPIPAGRFVLLPEPSLRANPLLRKIGLADEKGLFTIDAIRPGEYTLIALPDEDRFTPPFLRSSELIQKYERFGRHISIGPGETTHTDLTAAPVELN